MKKVGGVLLILIGVITFIRAAIDVFSGNFMAVIGLLFGLAILFIGYSLFIAKPKSTPRAQNIQTQNRFDQPKPTPSGARPFSTNVVGCKYPNEDGSSRQEIIEQLNIGDRVSLQPYKYKGKNAIYVVSDYGIVGNLKKELSDEFESKVRTGHFLYAEIEDIWPYEGDLYLSVILWQKQ